MRSMLDMDIPLNAGCLVPLDSKYNLHTSEFADNFFFFKKIVQIPKKSLLSPSKTAAVCGGNVLTSQRIVDVVLKAFQAAAASQGCTK